MEKEKDHRINRVLSIYQRLEKGQILNKDQLALEFGVNNKSIQRDIEHLRFYLANQPDCANLELKYSRKHRGYQLLGSKNHSFDRKKILLMLKILLASRPLNQKEISDLINMLLVQLDEPDQKLIKELIGNEVFNYVPLRHDSDLIDKVWDLSQIINRQQMIKISYLRHDERRLHRNLKPVSIMFSDFYFYLIAYMEEPKYYLFSYDKLNNDYLRVFRVDRIESYEALDEKFYLPYSNRFEEGEFRKRIQFMFLGELIKVKFEFHGSLIEPVLDRLPTATILEQEFNKYVIEAEVYGKGIIMWLMSQSTRIRVLSPPSLVEEMKDEIRRLSQMYDQ